MSHASYPDSKIRRVLNTVRTIAMVGASANHARPSFLVFKYLMERGFRMIPVNPVLAGKDLLGQTAYASLKDVPEPIDMVDIFRDPAHVPAIVDEALALNPKPAVIWMQLGIRHEEAAAVAEAAGVEVIMDRCPKIEYGRLSSEIGWLGVNSRTISSKRATRLGSGVQRMSLGRETFSIDTPDKSSA